MKKAISVILSVFLLLGAAGCSDRAPAGDARERDIYLTRTTKPSVYGVEAPDSNDDMIFQTAAQTAAAQTPAAARQEEMRAVWLSYLTLEPMAKGMTQAQFTQNAAAAFQNAANLGFNTVFVHARPFGDAFYRSQYFPWSAYLTGEEGKDPGYDPLAILCSLADDYGLRIEAWLNPYRVRASYNQKPMSAGNPAKKWVAEGNGGALEWQGGVYYNPGSAKARELIVQGVQEIVENYDVDGIHFDDYFYPTTDMSFDAKTYSASGSALSQADWRRENVDKLVRQVYAAVKQADPDCVFGISPQGNVKTNYEGQFADSAKWLSEPGYVDYICPQVYYGYQNGTCPYAETVAQWDEMIQVEGIRLYVGLAAYKLGQTDDWAGEGKSEWIGTTDLLARMVQTARGASHYGGVAFYAYESLFPAATGQVQAESRNLKALFS